MKTEVFEEIVRQHLQEDEEGNEFAQLQVVFEPGAAVQHGLVRPSENHKDLFVILVAGQVADHDMAGQMRGKQIMLEHYFEASAVQRVVVPMMMAKAEEPRIIRPS